MIVLCEDPVWTESEVTDELVDLLMRPIDLLTGRYDPKFQSVVDLLMFNSAGITGH